MYDDKGILDAVVELCKESTKLRDLELNLRKNEHLERVLEVVKRNFMLKTLILK